MANRILAFGTVLEYSTDDGTTWKSVAGLSNVDTPSGTTEEVDGTGHDSPGGYRELIPGLKDAGEVSLEGFYDPNDESHDGAAGLPYLWGTGDVVAWRVRSPAHGANSGVEFDGYVSAFQATFPVDGLMGFTATIRASGPTTFPAGA